MKALSIAIASICILSVASSAFAGGHNRNQRNHQIQKENQWHNRYDYPRQGYKRYDNRHNYHATHHTPYFRYNRWTPRIYCINPTIVYSNTARCIW